MKKILVRIASVLLVAFLGFTLVAREDQVGVFSKVLETGFVVGGSMVGLSGTFSSGLTVGTRTRAAAITLASVLYGYARRHVIASAVNGALGSVASTLIRKKEATEADKVLTAVILSCGAYATYPWWGPLFTRLSKRVWGVNASSSETKEKRKKRT